MFVSITAILQYLYLQAFFVDLYFCVSKLTFTSCAAKIVACIHVGTQAHRLLTLSLLGNMYTDCHKTGRGLQLLTNGLASLHCQSTLILFRCLNTTMSPSVLWRNTVALSCLQISRDDQFLL